MTSPGSGDVEVLDTNKIPADELPEGQPSIVTRSGDLWRVGPHKIICGDVRDESTLTTLMQDRHAALVFTDPPYNVAIEGNVSGKGAVKHADFAMGTGEMSKAEFTQFLSESLGSLARKSMNGAIHFVCMDWRHMGELLAAGEAVYDTLLNLCVWAKNNGGQGSFRVVTTDSNHALPIAENLLARRFTVARANTVWVGDMTYISTGEGWLYLAVVLHLFSRRIVGWSMGPAITAELACRALDMACYSRTPAAGLLFHSDRGSQYASRLYGPSRRPWDQCFHESQRQLLLCRASPPAEVLKRVCKQSRPIPKLVVLGTGIAMR
jgi:hypothetical protein